MRPKEHTAANVEPFPIHKTAEPEQPAHERPEPEQPAPEQPQAKQPEPRKPRAPTCERSDLAEKVTPIFEKIQALRKRPLFVLVAETIDDEVCHEVHSWRAELAEAGAQGDMDVLIQSYGGDLDACYQVARLLSRRVNAWEALVPAVSASGATLILLGSSNVVMSEIARLSPIDPQVMSKRHEKFFAMERQSPLEAAQALRSLTEVALESVCGGMMFLLQHGVAPKPALDSAVTLAYHLVQPILARIEPYDVGSFSLDSSLALSYCERIGNPANTAKKTQREVPFSTLVERYPAHGFVIDIEEAVTLNFKASEPSPELDELFEELREHLDELDLYIGRIPTSEAKP